MKRSDIIKYGLCTAFVFFAYLVSILGFKDGKPTFYIYVCWTGEYSRLEKAFANAANRDLERF